MCRLLLKTNIGDEAKLFEHALGLMKHGGPDATHILEENDIAFGHNRLAIIDKSSMADQPMMIDGNIILFNGEIYNHEYLKEQHNLAVKTKSDTEVVLRLYNLYGDLAFDLLDGEFAIVIYDGEEETIKLVRDRIGIKQLYYHDGDGDLIVSSEIKSILPFIGDAAIEEPGAESWASFGYPNENFTLFKGVSKVLPNTIMEFDKKGLLLKSTPLDLPVYEKVGDKDELALTLARCVGKRMMSDVPISCTLSGGIDSSIIAYLMSKLSKDKIKTYTVGFEDCDDEFEEARKVAEFIKSDHTEVRVSLKTVLESIDDILDTMEEPIDRGSLIPTYFLAKAIKEKVTLIGEGADEVFGGYSRHTWLKDNPNATFEEYFKKNLQAFPVGDVPLMYDNWEDKNSALKFDMENEIPNYHTIRIDKCMMKFGIEARVPFLDPEITSVFLDVPFGLKTLPEKRILREAFRGLLPDEVINRPKKALKFPFSRLVTLQAVEKVIRQESINQVDKEYIDFLYRHLDAKNSARDLWNIFLFKKWEEKNLK